MTPPTPDKLRRAANRLALLLTACLLGLSVAVGADTPPSGTAAAAPAVPAYRQANRVAVLTVKGEIDFITLRSLERRIEDANREGVDAIVLEIDTPGGRLDATLDICNLLKDRSATPQNTVAWIRPQAYSAGTIIALACREIVVAPNASFGDAAPIVADPVRGLQQLAAAERAKAEAPILSEVIDSARRHHYDENLVQSFISVGIELWMIENIRTGERIFVNRGEYETVFGEAPPQQMTPVAPPQSAGPPPAPVRPWINSSIPRPPQDEEMFTPEQLREQIEYQQQLPPTRGPLTEDGLGRWRLITQVVSNDRLLTVKRDEALFYGLAVTTVGNDDQLKSFFGAQSVTRYNQSWSESMVRVLVSWPVRIVLIVVFLLALFIELAVPGMGVFGATAAVALLMLVGAPYLAGMAQWWDVLLIGLGLVLLAMEVFVIPGLGVAGIAGAVCLLAGLIGTFVSGGLDTSQGQEELGTGIASVLTALFAAGVGIWLISRQIHSFPILDRLLLKTELRSPRQTGAEHVGVLEAMGAEQRALQVGDVGAAETDLRPSGRGAFGGRIVDVQSVGRYIEKGSPIRVISVGRYVIEVEDAD